MEGFANPNGVGWGHAQPGQVGNSIVIFFQDKKIDPEKSAQEGRPVNVNADFVKVMHPGERDYSVLEVSDSHKFRWPQQWAAYQAKREQKPSGTPLDILFPDNPALVENLRLLNFHTVEQMATANDAALQGVGMGCREYQAKARKFLEAANGSQGFHKLTSEVEQLRSERDSLKDAVEKMQARLNALEIDAPKRGPGRPRKVEAA